MNQFPNFTVSRNGEKRYPLLNCSKQDPGTFFSCDHRWQVCSYDFTFRKIISDSITYKASKFKIVEDYFYGKNDPTNGAENS